MLFVGCCCFANNNFLKFPLPYFFGVEEINIKYLKIKTSRCAPDRSYYILGACRNSFLFFVSDRINLDSLKISE